MWSTERRRLNGTLLGGGHVSPPFSGGNYENTIFGSETYSSVDLGKASVYRYVESPDFDLLLFGYSVDGGEARVVDLAQGERIPLEIIDALTDTRVRKWAFNAQFERVCLSPVAAAQRLPAAQ